MLENHAKIQRLIKERMSSQRYIVRAINPSDMSVVITEPGGSRSASRRNAHVFCNLKAAIKTRDIARKDNKSAWIAFV